MCMHTLCAHAFGFCMSMCVNMRVRACAYVCACVYIHPGGECVRACVCTFVRVHVPMWRALTYVCVSVYMPVCMCVPAHACVRVFYSYDCYCCCRCCCYCCCFVLWLNGEGLTLPQRTRFLPCLLKWKTLKQCWLNPRRI